MTEPASRTADLLGAAAPAAPVLTCPKSTPKPTILKKRAEFQAASRARRQSSRAFVLQARKRRSDEVKVPAGVVRVGYTCSKKVGNAVARNRAKRRLRAAVHEVLRSAGQPGWDYVLVGRRDETAAIEFTQLLADLQAAITRIHAPKVQG